MTHDNAVELTEPVPPVRDEPFDPNAETLHPPAPTQELPPLPAPADDYPVLPRATSAREPGRRTWRFLPRNLTARLVLGVVSLVVVIVLAISAATYVALSSYLGTRLDKQVQSTASGPLDRIFEAPRTGTTLGPGLQTPQQVWAVALDYSGNVITQPATGSTVNALQLSADERTSIAARVANTSDASIADLKPITVTTTTGVQLRVVLRQANAYSLSTGTSQRAIAVIGLSTSEVSRTLHQLLLLELGIGGGAVLLAFVATAYGVRLSLRPLKRVTSTARDVTAELSPDGAGLDRRVPVTAAESDTEVGQVAESVNTLLGAVETQFAARLESEQRMRQFLADASHELRTPLTSIRGYAELARMRRQFDAQDDGDGDTLDRIESEGTRMSRLVDDLLTLARSDRGAVPQREPVDVAELIDDAVDGARAAYPQRRIDVIAPIGLAVLGDNDQLLRVLRNLIANAAVHTQPDGPIRVSGRAEGDWVVLRVDDSGPGLGPDEAAHVFERFWRADKARTRAKGGSGLGMSIVASIVEAHGGTVRFDTAIETGSTVTVALPVGSHS